MHTLIDMHTGDLYWSAIHQSWSVYIAELLRPVLPDGFVAWPGVARKQEGDAVVLRSQDAWRDRGEAVWLAEPDRVLLVGASASYAEVRVVRDDHTLAGLVELVSPSNLDRPQARGAICGKVEAALADGVGVAWIDTVTTLSSNLHRLLLQSLGDPDPEADPLYAASYAKARGHRELAVWYQPLSVGQVLPELPLTLKDGPQIPLPLAAAYELLWERHPMPNETASG